RVRSLRRTHAHAGAARSAVRFRVAYRWRGHRCARRDDTVAGNYPRCSRGRSGSLEQIDTVEGAGAHVAIVAERVATAAFIVTAFDVDRSGPVLGSLGRLECAFFPLRVPVLDVHLLDRTIEILDFDRAVVVVESYHLEQRATVEAIPVADTGLRSRHRRHLPKIFSAPLRFCASSAIILRLACDALKTLIYDSHERR